jgi:hypothetical protein
MMRRAARRANVKPGVHILRHTFCSHLAMRGAPARAIQELAGHQDLDTTQRYMHLSPAALDAAIRLLDESGPAKAGHYIRQGSNSPTHQLTNSPTHQLTNLPILSEESIGGGGSRTRVRRYFPEGLYMRIRFCCFMPGVWKRLRTARH